MPAKKLLKFCTDSLLIPEFIEDLLSQTAILLQNRIKPIWVFDPIPDISYLPIPVDPIVLQTISQAFNKAEELLKYAGIPCVKAEKNAEALCSILANLQKSDYFSGETLESLYFANDKNSIIVGLHKKYTKMYEINIEKMLYKMGISKPQFLDLCILYEKIGTQTTNLSLYTKFYKYICEYNDLEGIFENIPLEFKMQELLERRKFINDILDQELYYFHSLNKSESLKFTVPNIKALKSFLNENGIPKKQICESLKIVEKFKPESLHKMKQSRIEDFFKPRKKVPGVVYEKKLPLFLRQSTIVEYFQRKSASETQDTSDIE